ncbi:MAG: Spy/CpxP family protein refolding chaperone [Deltaproteobacteria bacterium]|nr:Spy/CpxP family protein refolding chaperone [Deltaproteobacteria bacterium]
MKKKRWILLGGLIILAIIGFSMVSHAGRHFANPMAMGPMYRLNLLSEELGLTDDQRAALKNLVRSHRQEIQPLVKAVIAKKRTLQELVLAEKPDPAAIRQASADLGNAIAEAAVLGSVLAQKAQSILTPDQFNRFRTMRQNRQKVFDETLREWQERNPAF